MGDNVGARGGRCRHLFVDLGVNEFAPNVIPDHSISIFGGREPRSLDSLAMSHPHGREHISYWSRRDGQDDVSEEPSGVGVASYGDRGADGCGGD